ncbi:hypothetical protein [Micromonospora sp. NPDC000442]
MSTAPPAAPPARLIMKLLSRVNALRDNNFMIAERVGWGWVSR